MCNGEVPWPFPFLLFLGNWTEHIGSGPAQGGGDGCYGVGWDGLPLHHTNTVFSHFMLNKQKLQKLFYSDTNQR